MQRQIAQPELVFGWYEVPLGLGGGGAKGVGWYPLPNSLPTPCSKSELTQSDLNTVLLR